MLALCRPMDGEEPKNIYENEYVLYHWWVALSGLCWVDRPTMGKFSFSDCKKINPFPTKFCFVGHPTLDITKLGEALVVGLNHHCITRLFLR